MSASGAQASDSPDRATRASWFLWLRTARSSNDNQRLGESDSRHRKILWADLEYALELDIGDLAEVASAVGPDGATVVVVEGVLYNAGELRQDLEIPVTASAADLVAAAYDRWGRDALQRVKGMYALAIWDANRQTLICARDRLGVYPFFIASKGGQTLVSPDVEALRSHPLVGGAVSRIALASHLVHRWTHPDETYFEGIRRVPPGSTIEFRRGSETMSRYWDPLPAGEPIQWAEGNHVEQFNELLDQAVARAVDQGVTGIFLSGGLDSISVAALAAEQAHAKGLHAPLAMSLVFPHPECNEEVKQRGVAQDLDLPLLIKSLDDALGPRGLVLGGLAETAHSPFPLINIWLAAYHDLVREAVRKDVKVIVGGGGGDEWLAVTPLLAADLMSSFQFMELFRLWNTARRSWPLKPHQIFRNMFWRYGARALLMSAADRLTPGLRPALHRRHIPAGLPSWLAPDAVLRRQLEERLIQDAPRYRIGQFYANELRASLDHALVSMEMEEHFLSWRRFGVRVLQPYWDPDLIEFLMRVPPEVLNRQGRSKGLVRQSISERFPQLGFERQKKVVATNFARERLRAEVPSAWKQLGGAEALARLGVVEPDLLRKQMDDILGGSALPRMYMTWDILNVESWARAH